MNRFIPDDNSIARLDSRRRTMKLDLVRRVEAKKKELLKDNPLFQYRSDPEFIRLSELLYETHLGEKPAPGWLDNPPAWLP